MKFMGFTFTAALFMLCVWEGAEAKFGSSLDKKMVKFMGELNPQCSMGLPYNEKMKYFSDNLGMQTPALFQFIEAGIKLSKTWHSKKSDTIDEAEVYSVMINVMHDHSEMVQAYNHECMNQYKFLWKDEVNGFLNRYLEANHQYLIQLCRRVKHPIDKDPEFPGEGNYDKTFIDDVTVKKNAVLLKPALGPMEAFLTNMKETYDEVFADQASDVKYTALKQIIIKRMRLTAFLSKLSHDLKYNLAFKQKLILYVGQRRNNYDISSKFDVTNGDFRVMVNATLLKKVPECMRKEAKRLYNMIGEFIQCVIYDRLNEILKLEAESQQRSDAVANYLSQQQRMREKVGQILEDVNGDGCSIINKSGFFQIDDTETVDELERQIATCEALLKSLKAKLEKKLSQQ